MTLIRFSPPVQPTVGGYTESSDFVRDTFEAHDGSDDLYAHRPTNLSTVQVTWQALTAEKFRPIWSFLSQAVAGGAVVFEWTPPDPIPEPGWAPLLGFLAGGSSGARTLDVSTSWHGVLGETIAGPEAEIVLAANQLLTVSMPCMPPNGATGWRVYVDGKLEATVSDALSWTEPVSGLLGNGAVPPGVNTLDPPRPWVLASPATHERTGPTTYRISAVFKEQMLYL